MTAEQQEQPDEVEASPDFQISEIDDEWELDLLFEQDCDFTFCAFRSRFCIRAEWMLAWICFFAVIQSALLSCTKSALSTLERRYQLSSAETGLIVAMHELGVLAGVGPATYLGAEGSRLRVLSLGGIVLGLGALAFILPQFVVDPFRFEVERIPCAVLPAPEPCGEGDERLRGFRFVFWATHLIMGACAAAVHTLPVMQIQENLEEGRASLHIAVLHAATVLGAALGAGVCGALLGVYVDLGEPHPGLVADDRWRWVGAWWAPYMLLANLCFVMAVPLYGFPELLPEALKRRLNSISSISFSTFSERMARFRKALPASLRRCLANPAFLAVALSGAAESLLVSALTSFGPKFVETRYGWDAGNAALAFGGLVSAAGAAGVFAGASLVHMGKPTQGQALRVTAVITLLTLPAVLAFLVPCGPGQDGAQLAGLDGNLSCSAACRCRRDAAAFEPWCAADGRTFFSPCQAGCDMDLRGEFTSCRCVPPKFNSTPPLVRPGPCGMRCRYAWPFLLAVSVLVFATFFMAMPTLAAAVLAVPCADRPVAVGAYWVVMHALGAVPGPPLLGALLDSTCMLWGRRCGRTLHCLAYSPGWEAVAFAAFFLAARVVSLLLLAVARVFGRREAGGEDADVPGLALVQLLTH